MKKKTKNVEKNKKIVVIAIIILIAIITIVCVIAFVPKNQETIGHQNTQARVIDAVLNDNGDVKINLEDLDIANSTFINYVSNGTNIELVAIKDSKDNIDVAFNTCQVCNGSPKAYFVQENGKLVCKNCGNSFSLKSIGASANGCNPMTILDNDVTKTDTGILISKEMLRENEILFLNVAKH